MSVNQERREFSGRLGRWWYSGVVLMVALICLAGSAAALAQPIWRVDAIANSTVAPGDQLQYVAQVLNIGDAPTDGSNFTLTVTLPDHVTGVSVALNNFDFFVGWTCTAGDGSSPVAGASVIQCVSSFPITPYAGFFFAFPVITTAVDSGAAGTLTALFSLSGGGASNTATTVVPVRVSNDPPHFGIAAFDGQATASAAGDALTQAGGHPYAISTSLDFNTATSTVHGPVWPVEPAKDVLVDLPPGFAGFPASVAACSLADLSTSRGVTATPSCAPDSQVGTALVRTNALGRNFNVQGPIPVFNVVAPPDIPARFGFNLDGTVVTLDATVRSDGDYGLAVDARDLSEAIGVAGTTLTFWGVPSDSSHDSERACAGQAAPWQLGPTCQSGAAHAAFLRMPTSCPAGGAGLLTSAHADSWVHPGAFADASFLSHLPPGYPFPPVSDIPPSVWGAQQGTTGCDKVPFDPSLEGKPSAPVQAGEPAGFSFDLSLPQSSKPDTPGESDLRTAVVTLPVGVRVSPSSADGLAACTSAQIGLLGTGFPEPNPIRFSTADPTCPDGAKIGTVRIDTPVLDQPLSGSIYLAAPHDNPFGTLLAIYLVVKGPGLVIKLPGKVEANADNGQLTATFDHNPQLPFSNLHLEFKGGPRAPLVLPTTCNTYTTHAVLTSWSGKTVDSNPSFTVDRGPGGAPCAPTGFSPTFSAGVENPVAGKDSSFVLTLSRGDTDQELSSLTVDTPLGLTGRIKNTQLCSNAAADAGTCADASKVGRVTVGAGAGTNPFFISNGRAYITGPYHGAPFGLSIVVPAVAGPFDLGTVVVRAAIFVDKHTAQLRVVSNPLPTILQGIPLDVREVRVAMDRPHFIVNPTSCAEKHVLGRIGSVAGAVAHVSSRFQVGECAHLRLAPKMSLTVGSRHHTGSRLSTPFTTTLTQTPGQTNLRSVSVVLPTTLSALLPVINRACTLAEFDSGHCAKARAGSAVAVTPLLKDPLRGSVFFVKNPKHPLPDLMVALRGQVSFDLIGKVSIPGGTHLATRFDAIPDVPLTKFTLSLVSGTNGPLGTATNLCTAKARRATASIGFRGQNGDVLEVHPRLHIRGCGGKKR